MAKKSNDGIDFSFTGMTTKEAIDNLQGVAGFILMLFATGSIKENENPQLAEMFGKFPIAVNKAVIAMKTMDNEMEIENKEE